MAPKKSTSGGPESNVENQSNLAPIVTLLSSGDAQQNQSGLQQLHSLRDSPVSRVSYRGNLKQLNEPKCDPF